MAETEYRLKKLYLYLTFECNLMCKHCWVDTMKREKRTENVFNSNSVLNILKDAYDLGIEVLKISGGEPMLKSDVVMAVLEFIHKQKWNILLILETNGTIVPNNIIKQLKPINHFISLSLDSHIAEIHDKFRSKEGSFEKTVNSIIQYIQNGLNLGVVHCISNENYSSFNDFIAFMKYLRVENVSINPITYSGRAKENFNDVDSSGYVISTEDIVFLYNKYCFRSDINVSMFLPPVLSSKKFFLKKIDKLDTCSALELLSILPNGSVCLCGESLRDAKLVFGDISNTDIKTVWNSSSPLAKFRNDLKNIEGICSECIFSEKCLGFCRAQAYNYYQKNKSFPLCQKIADSGKFPKQFLK